MFRIGDVAQATGLTHRAIRYYEELGLLKPALHASGANRRYDQDDVERLQLIKRLREDVGLSLADIHAYVDVEEQRRQTKLEYLATSDPAVRLELLDRSAAVIRRRLALLDGKLASLAELRDEDAAALDRITALREQFSQLALAETGV